jgi:hypothetical protein
MVCVLLGVLCALLRTTFREEWHLSPEQSLLLQAEKTVIPAQDGR